jgi:hypothetical protein
MHARSRAAVKHRRVRRTLAVAAVIAGGLLMWLSPEALGGALLMAAGICLEALGIWLEHQDEPPDG